MVPKGKILHSFMLGTEQKLTPQENIEITEVMEREIEIIAKNKGFEGIFSTNTSPLTQVKYILYTYCQIIRYIFPNLNLLFS